MYKNKERDKMKIAVTYENGLIFQHFGHTEQFKIYEVAENEVIESKIVPTNGSGHGALSGFLKEQGVSVLICGGIGGGAKDALFNAGILLYGGVMGSCDKAVDDYLKGTLIFNPDVKCNHHDHDHEHSCGSHSCI